MKATCQNCNVTLGCSCQRRVASNGAPVCANCISNYETSLIQSSNTNGTTSVFYAKVTPATDNNSLNKL